MFYLQCDPTDKNTWQRNLYEKIGKRQMRGIDQMSADEVISKIANMGQVLSILHLVSCFYSIVGLVLIGIMFEELSVIFSLYFRGAS